jgi:hypothetical protein
MGIDKEFIKLSLTMTDEYTNYKKGVHFCYIEKELLNQFLQSKGYNKHVEMVNDVIKWIKHDFNIKLNMLEKKDMLILRQLIVDRYTQLHPNIFRSNVKSAGAWMRLWASEHMEKELKGGLKIE